MIATNRQRRAQVRKMIRESRAVHRATSAIATGLPQSAKTHLIASGVDTRTAARFAGAFSRNVKAVTTVTAKIKKTKRSRKTMPVEVKLYDSSTFRARLAVYRPKDAAAADVFERAAYALAA